MSITTPITFIIFNRPDLTAIVFERIRQVQPKKLLVIADAPRSAEEANKCEQARSIINKVDWDCEVMTNYSDSNLGCGIRISTGLDWVFSKVEEAIILEDDCLPSLSFFTFCETLLEYYRYDERIMHISGNNFQNGQSRTDASYYFSKYSHNWGWATWKRAWKFFDIEIKTWPCFRDTGLMNFVCENMYERDFWMSIFNNAYNRAFDNWDVQWLYTCWSQGGLSIHPDVNLVSNIGFRADATHTRSTESKLSNVPATDILEIHHPFFIVRNHQADEHTFNHVFGGHYIKIQPDLLTKFRSKIYETKKKVFS